MAIQEIIYLTGKIAWAKGLFSPSQFKKYSMKLCLDQPSLNLVLDLKKRGIQNDIVKNEDGYWINLSRPSELNIRGMMKGIMPPVVINAKGEPWNPEVAIGDTSDVTCKVVVRNWTAPVGGRKGVAIRLESVRIDHLVEFKDQWPEAEAKQVAGLKEAPQPAPF